MGRLQHLTLLTVIVAFVVVILGVYVRLSGAGLGCPDWPGCYGEISVPDVQTAQLYHPERPLEQHKAWKEMIHRYFAGALGVLILLITVWSFRQGQKKFIPSVLLLLVVAQGALGMWTVTHKLHPLIVMAHLLGGLATLSLLWVLNLQMHPSLKGLAGGVDLQPASQRRWSFVALTLLIVQIMLGGWTSANYAALVCPDFPTCLGQWVPPMDFSEGFDVMKKLGVDYEYGLLGFDARVAIQFTHRLGALCVALIVGVLGFKLVKEKHRTRTNYHLGRVLLLLLVLQIFIGIANVVFTLPLLVGVVHNAIAALLLVTMITICFRGKHVWS